MTQFSMRSKSTVLLLVAAVAAACTGTGGASGPELRPVAAPAPAGLPLLFVSNEGQEDEAVRYSARARGCAFFLTDRGAVLSVGRDSVRIVAEGGDATVDYRPEAPATARMNYLLGRDPRGWRTGVGTWQRIVAEQVYPGIDLAYRGAGRDVEFDFLVAPGADAGAIRLRYEGVRSLSIEDGGDLRLELPRGTIVQRAPLVWQVVDGERDPVEGRYVLHGEDRVGFEIAGRDPELALVIDPVLDAATYVGGVGHDFVDSVALAEDGGILICGTTGSVDFPATAGVVQDFLDTANDGFVAKFSADGKTLLWATFLGGPEDDDDLSGIVAAPGGDIYAVGSSDADSDFPGTDLSPIPKLNPLGRDAVVCRMSGDGRTLRWSAWIGGTSSGREGAFDVAVAPDGGPVIGGLVNSPGLIGVGPGSIQSDYTHAVRRADGFVMKLAADGTSIAWATYIGSSALDQVYRVRVGPTGDVYASGIAGAGDLPVTAGAAQTTFGGGGYDAFVCRISADGSTLVYSTYLGGSGYDTALGLTVDGAGRAWAAGATASTDYPVTPATAVQSTSGGGTDGNLSRLSADGSTLEYSTYLGGAGQDVFAGIDRSAAGDLLLAGYTDSADFPLVDAFRTVVGGARDGFVCRVAGDGSVLLGSSFLGGDGSDLGYDVVALPGGRAAVTGFGDSTDLATPGAFDGTFGGALDGFLAVVSGLGDEPTAPAVSLTAFGEEFAVDGDVRGWTTGKPMEFEVVATDANAADTITVEGFLDGVLIPETGPGATLSAPAGANPVSRTFTWTPVQADEGSRSLVFEATDSTGLMTRVTVTVEVVHDSDGDGIPDDWELSGIPYEGDRIPLPGADPDVPDVYVEIDFMGSTDESGGDVGHDHRPLDHALDWIVSSFEDRGIALHLLLDDEIPHRDELGPDPAVYDWPAFDELKSAWFTPGHAAVYRYCLFVHTMGGSDTSGISRNEPDRFELGASDFVVSLGYTSDAEDPPNGTEDEQAGTFMHELGHNLGLHHGGFEDVGYKPNYLSVMNYHFQEGLLVTANLNKQTEHIRFDYSEIRFADLDENLLTESFGIGAGAEYSIYDTWRHYRGNLYREADVSDGIDWNSDGDTLDTVAADVNNGGGKSLLVGHDDWSNLVFTGGAVGARGGVVRLPPTTTGTEQGLTEIRERTPVAPNAYEPVAVVSSASLAPGEDGNAVLTLDGSASSDGDGEALSFRWYSNGEPIATGATATVTLEPGSYEIALVVEDRWYRSETAPLTVAVAGADQDLTASPYWIWPPNGRMVPVTVSTKAEGGTVRVVGVTSNEEIAGDWETTSDPSVVKLRADRDGEGDGRVYTVEVEVTAGSTVYTGWVEVFVGHDQRAKKDSPPPEEETGDAAPAGEEPAPTGEEPAPAPAEETTVGGETSTGDASATGDEAPAGTTGDEPSTDGSADGGTDSGGTDGGAEAPTGSETPEIDGSEDFGEEAGQSSGGTDPDGKKEGSGPDEPLGDADLGGG